LFLVLGACGNHKRNAAATVQELNVMPGELVPAFAPQHTEYTVSHAYGVDAVLVQASIGSAGSALSINGQAVASGQPFGPVSLTPGENAITVVVIAPQAQGSRIYNVVVARAPGLAGVDLSAGTLRPAFAPDTLEYDIDLSAPALGLTPRVAEAGVGIKVVGQDAVAGAPRWFDVALGERTIPLTLTSADGKVTRTYTFRLHRAAPTMTQEAYAKALNRDPEDAYGTALAADGERMAVGVPLEDSLLDPGRNQAQDAGGVYVLERDANGWLQRYLVKATNAENFDLFGSAVALSGGTLVVGAPQESSDARGVNGDKFNNRAPGSGAAYVFVRRPEGMVIEAYLKASNTDDNDNFGRVVAISGDRIAVGAPREASGARGVGGAQHDNTVAGAGAVYVFCRTGDQWTQEAYIKATNSGGGDHFGSALALAGDTLVVGARDEDSSATGVDGRGDNDDAPQSGAAYVYVVRNGVWHPQGYLKASNTGAGDVFGSAVAVHGDFIAVGAPAEASASRGVGGDQNDNSAPGAGAVYVFRRAAGVWEQHAYVKAGNTHAGDGFGTTLVLDASTLLVGAPFEDGMAEGIDGDGTLMGASDAGAAYAFVRDGSTWFQRHYVKASNAEAGDRFGSAVALSAGWAMIGAPLEDSGAAGMGGNQRGNEVRDSGAGYVFRVR
jgi:hypothetical protein